MFLRAQDQKRAAGLDRGLGLLEVHLRGVERQAQADAIAGLDRLGQQFLLDHDDPPRLHQRPVVVDDGVDGLLGLLTELGQGVAIGQLRDPQLGEVELRPGVAEQRLGDLHLQAGRVGVGVVARAAIVDDPRQGRRDGDLHR